MSSRWFWAWIAFCMFVLAAGLVLVFGERSAGATAESCTEATSQQDTRLRYLMTPNRAAVCQGTLPIRWWVERPCQHPAAGCAVPASTGGYVYGYAPLRGGDVKALRLNVMNPQRHNRVILFVHGGGFIAGSRVDHNWAGLVDLAARGFTVVTIDYRLQGDNPAGPARNAEDRAITAAVEDTLTAAAWVRAKYQPAALYLVGSSAGAITALNAGAVTGFDGVVAIAGAVTDGTQGTTPTLQIHHELDPAIEYRPLNADLILLPGTGHAVKLSGYHNGRRWTHHITRWIITGATP